MKTMGPKKPKKPKMTRDQKMLKKAGVKSYEELNLPPGMIPKAQYGRGVVSTSEGSTYTKAGKKIGSGIGKKAEYRDFSTGEGDRSFAPTASGMAEKMRLRKANKEASKSGNIKVAKTGGMVNSNKKVTALKSAGSKGVKSGVNPEAAAQKFPKGRSGGRSTAPKGAVPKAKYGMVMRRK